MAPPTVEEIIKDYVFKPELLDRVSFRKVTRKLEIVPPNPEWPAIFEIFRERIVSALGPEGSGGGFLAIHHRGSTSIPGMPAKDVIDIDLVVPDVTDEKSYVAPLEAVGFHFLTREPHWHEHRFFCAYEPQSANLHVWGPDCPEVERHRIFRDWMLEHEDDRELYAKVKEECARQTSETGGTVMDYNLRKEETIRHILRKAFKQLGYIE
jgi:GrpB-like predicted nucleotidyltransferase (UPF0157 family)